MVKNLDDNVEESRGLGAAAVETCAGGGGKNKIEVVIWVCPLRVENIFSTPNLKPALKENRCRFYKIFMISSSKLN
jgi:hypothetical protein